MSSTENVNRRVYMTTRKTTQMSSEYRVVDGDAGSDEQKGRFCSPSADSKDCCLVTVVVKLLVCVLCGMVFGTALQKANGM